MIKDGLLKLRDQRQIINHWNERIDEAQAHLEKTIEYQELEFARAQLTEAKAEADDVTTFIKQEVELAFVRTGLKNTKPYDGIQIKKFSVVHILDERGAIKWAAINAPQVLSLKKTPFNKIAKVLNLDFVEIDNEYRVQIASDLSMYEEKEND